MDKNIYLFGSLAYDSIITYDGHFKELIDSDIERSYNFSFLSKKVNKEFGGCAGNIAYNLNLLNIPCEIVSSLGSDRSDYMNHFEKLNISTRYIKLYNDELTAQAHIIADHVNNQITSFYQGVLGKKNVMSSLPLNKNDIAIISPDNTENMKEYIRILNDKNVRFLFDPGQVVSLFEKEELEMILNQAYLTIVNDYEYDILKNILDITDDVLFEKYTIIITKGENGSCYINKKIKYSIETYKPNKIIDSTGCGDSYRAGLLYGLYNNLDIIESLKIGSSIATFNIEYSGTQNHFYNFNDVLNRINENNL